MESKNKRRITAEGLYDLQMLTSSEISPDGQYILYGLQRVDPETEKKHTNLWLVPTNQGEPRRITCGKQKDEDPKWSPDGTAIAFLSNRQDEKQFQLYILPMKGGEAFPITDLNGDFGKFAWSPNSQKLVFEFRKKDAETLQREQDEKKKRLGITARRIDRIFYKLDGYGYLPRERWHLWTVDQVTRDTHQITDSKVYDDLEPAWSPDGKHIVFCSNHSDNPDLNFESIDLFITDLEGKFIKKLDTPPGTKQTPRFSPDGKRIAYVGQDGLHNDWKNNNLWIVDQEGTSPAINLTGKFDFQVSGWTINDYAQTRNIAPVWSNDGSKLFFTVARHGNTDLLSISTDGNNCDEIFSGNGVVLNFTIDLNNIHIALEHSDIFTPGQILLQNLKRKTTKSLINVNQEWINNIALGTVEEIWFKGADANDLQGWILKPPDFDEKKSYPAILEIHGGPLVQYGNIFMHEFFYLAAQDYVIFFCNPRGGQGYGEEHAKAIHGAWGTADFEDLMLWTDIVSHKPYVDSQRLGVTGGSYGGYMTNWIIGHTNHFNAAVTQRSVSNLTSMWGSSDFNWAFQETFDNKAPYESIEVLWQCSPIKHIGAAKTPTMVIHSEQDLRCPLEQGEQVYVALKKLGVDTEFVVFPEEPHGLSRGGRTDRRIERLKSISGWFERYLK